jgi:hypothetical protein
MSEPITVEQLEKRLGTNRPNIERMLGLPQRSLDKELETPEGQALAKMVYCMPWLLEVADDNFDPRMAAVIQKREAAANEVRLMRELIRQEKLAEAAQEKSNDTIR